jgi:copper(I)-binding protein
MSNRTALAALALALIGTLQAAPGITIEDPWTRATAPGQAVAGGFMTLVNASGADDRLLRASSPVAKEVQIHNTSMDGGVMRMRQLPEGVAVPAGARVEFKPRALHLMFMELKAPIAVGSTVPVTLEFERAGKVETTFRVQATAAPAAPAPAAPAAPAGHDHHKMKHEH